MMIEKQSQLQRQPEIESPNRNYTSKDKARAVGVLHIRNVRIHGRRTSVRLAQGMWQALVDISAVEKCTIHVLCSAVDDTRGDESCFTAALRSFIAGYFGTSVADEPLAEWVRMRIREILAQQQAAID